MMTDDDTYYGMTSTSVFSWIFLAVAYNAGTGPARLSDILNAADSINHARPLVTELKWAFRWLILCGYVYRDGKNYGLTEKGRMLNAQADKSGRAVYKQWDYLKQVFADIDTSAETYLLTPEVDSLTTEEIKEADAQSHRELKAIMNKMRVPKRSTKSI